MGKGKLISTTEHKEQATVIKYCCIKKITVFAIPNGTNIPSHKGRAKAKREGLKSGVPDLFLPIPTDKYHGLFIEMKKPKCAKSGKGKPSKEQLEWIDKLNSNRYKAVVCYGSNEAIETIDSYLIGAK